MDASSVKPTSSPPPLRHGNLALQPGFCRTFSPTAPRIGPCNPGARAPIFPERRWYSRPHLSSPLRRGPFRVIWAIRPQRPLSTGTSVPGTRASPLALIAGGIYPPTSATLLPFALVQAGIYDPSLAPSQPVLLYSVLPTSHHRRALCPVPIALLRLGPTFNGVCHFSGSFPVRVTPCELTHPFCCWFGASRAN